MPKKASTETVTRHKMVGWYNPRQLGKTAYEVAISTIFGRHADRRILQSLTDTGSLRKKIYYELRSENDNFWFDYVSDVGDGFDSTYTVAYHLSQPALELTSNEGIQHSTNRGELLVFGGDEVYPTASHTDYRQRLVDPYELAFPSLTEKQLEKLGRVEPVVFAIPGNHDWYDSLVAFGDRFCSQIRFAGWRTKQNRSYFALKLPKGWWLFGTDMQLGSSLDKAQIDYFKRVMEHVDPENKIILCNAEPHWITAEMYKNDHAYDNRNMGYFEGGVLRGQVAVYIAGDRHYYRHHQLVQRGENTVAIDDPDTIHKFVAGGGGAFLHPTHNEKVETIGRRDKYGLRTSFPDEKTSRSLTYKNLLFPLLNPWFILVPGAIYLLTAQAYMMDLTRFGPADVLPAIGTVVRTALTQPLAAFWTILIYLGFIFFTDAHSKVYQRIAGPIHATVHLIALFGVVWAVESVVGSGVSLQFWGNLRLLAAGFLILVIGGVVGSLIMGMYLLVSLNYFGVHHNEAFSSLCITDFKNFLRLKISADGSLTVYPVGIEKVTKAWSEVDGKVGDSKLKPSSDSLEQLPFLIENPVNVAAPGRVRETERSNTSNVVETVLEHDLG